MSELSSRERIILAIDTSQPDEAERLAKIAKAAGARFVKLGLELSSATSWKYCSDLAAENGLDWVADAKIDDIPNTVRNTVGNIRKLDHPPFGITIHTTAGIEAMRAAQEEANKNDKIIKMLGVTVLTSVKDEEAREIYHVSASQEVLELAFRAVDAGIEGIVCSPMEVGMVKNNPKTRNLFAMIPGSRMTGAETHDQNRPKTPAETIKAGADLLVIGRPITDDKQPDRAFEAHVVEIESEL
ncbi:MAG: orotidine-5'-phosphate decarboxylase [Candidatus Saccharibacteria bacterium]